MPNPDGTPLWNEAGFQSTLQQYLSNGGDANRAGEFLYAGGAQGNTVADRTRDFMRDRTPAELARARQRDSDFASGFLNSPGYNPGGANSYLISNSVGLNSGFKPAQIWSGNRNNLLISNVPYNENGGLGSNAGLPNPVISTGTENRPNTPQTPGITETPNSPQTRNTGNTLLTNSVDLNKNRQGMFKRGTTGGFSNGAQYMQGATLNGESSTTGSTGFGDNWKNSAMGRGFGNGSNWSRAIWR